MEHEAESLLSASLASLSKGRQKLFTHIGLWVSLLALLIAALATFTNISILSLSAETLTITVAVYAAVTVVIFFSLAEDAYFYFASLRSFQTFHGFIVGYNFTDKSRIVYFYDAVACHDAYFFGWTSRNNIADVDCILLNGKLNTDTTETSFEVIVYSL